MERVKNYYDILGIKKSAASKEIYTAFKTIALKWHPDRVSDSLKETAHNKFIEINEANEILSDVLLRKEYDLLYERDYENRQASDSAQYSKYEVNIKSRSARARAASEADLKQFHICLGCRRLSFISIRLCPHCGSISFKPIPKYKIWKHYGGMMFIMIISLITANFSCEAITNSSDALVLLLPFSVIIWFAIWLGPSYGWSFYYELKKRKESQYRNEAARIILNEGSKT